MTTPQIDLDTEAGRCWASLVLIKDSLAHVESIAGNLRLLAQVPPLVETDSEEFWALGRSLSDALARLVIVSQGVLARTEALHLDDELEEVLTDGRI